MPPKKLKRLKNDTLPTPDIPNTDNCLLNEMPYEIMEMIFGKVNFIDLPNLLRVSKGITSAFKSMKYGRQLQVIQKPQVPLSELYRNLRNNQHVEWHVEDVLKTFTDLYCECGQYGYYLFWIHNPVKKICRQCLLKPEYQCNRIAMMLKHYHLTKRDIKHLPTATVDIMAITEFRIGTNVALQGEIEKIAERKHANKFEPLPPPLMSRPPEWYYYGRLGFINVPSYDVQDNETYLPLECDGCTNELGQKFLMPHNYRSLRNHIASVHPNIFENFEAGWKRLGSRIQTKWQESGAPSDLRYSLPNHFESWTRILNSELKDDSPLLSNLENAFSDWLMTIQENEGSFFKIPELSGFVPRSPNQISLIKSHVGRVVAKTMLSRGMTAMIKRLKQEIEVNGLDSIRLGFPDLFPAEEMKEIEKYMADHNYTDQSKEKA